MTVLDFKKRLIDLIGQEKYSNCRVFYMRMYATGYKADKLDELSELLDLVEVDSKNPQINIKYPESYFIQFPENDEGKITGFIH